MSTQTSPEKEGFSSEDWLELCQKMDLNTVMVTKGDYGEGQTCPMSELLIEMLTSGEKGFQKGVIQAFTGTPQELVDLVLKLGDRFYYWEVVEEKIDFSEMPYEEIRDILTRSMNVRLWRKALKQLPDNLSLCNDLLDTALAALNASPSNDWALVTLIETGHIPAEEMVKHSKAHYHSTIPRAAIATGKLSFQDVKEILASDKRKFYKKDFYILAIEQGLLSQEELLEIDVGNPDKEIWSKIFPRLKVDQLSPEQAMQLCLLTQIDSHQKLEILKKVKLSKEQRFSLAATSESVYVIAWLIDNSDFDHIQLKAILDREGVDRNAPLCRQIATKLAEKLETITPLQN